jgi:hypothetical protein
MRRLIALPVSTFAMICMTASGPLVFISLSSAQADATPRESETQLQQAQAWIYSLTLQAAPSGAPIVAMYNLRYGDAVGLKPRCDPIGPSAACGPFTDPEPRICGECEVTFYVQFNSGLRNLGSRDPWQKCGLSRRWHSCALDRAQSQQGYCAPSSPSRLFFRNSILANIGPKP